MSKVTAVPRHRLVVSPESTLAVACALVALLVGVSQLAHLSDLLDVHQILTAGFAKALVLFFGLAVVAIAAAAALLAPARLPVLVAVSAGVAALPVVATLTLGMEIWPAVAAWLTLAACWQIGAWTLLLVRAPAFASHVPAAWLTGTAVLGLALFAVGRAGALWWWLAGVPVVAVGVLASVRLGRMLAAGGARSAWSAMTTTRQGACAAAVSLLVLGLASVFTAAPEIMFDPLYGKVWLPQEWARTGDIGPLVTHPVLNTLGFAQLLAVPGHLVGAGDVGRYMQLIAAALLVAALWWGSRRSPWAPFVAGALAITPHLFWQATTADDDALLALGAVCMALAIIRALERPGSPVRDGLALGIMAGALVDLKLHLAALAAGSIAGWWLARRAGWRGALGLVGGGLAAVIAPIVIRWVDTGNPFLPAYNNIFKSRYWPPVNEQFNFPYYKHPGNVGPLDVIVRSATDTTVLNEAAPIGAFGLLVGALVIALLLAWRRGDRRPAVTPVLWLGVLLATVVWYQQLRYLRYLLPTACVGLLAIGIIAPARDIGARVQRAAIAAFAALAVLLWPATVAQFWNVPGRDLPWQVALRLKSDDSYERASMLERGAVLAFDRLAPAGAMAASDAHERLWLHDGRDLTPDFEVTGRLEALGGLPRGGDETLRRFRRLGITWMIVGAGSVSQHDYIQALLASHGEVEYSDVGWTVYKLVDKPSAPSRLPDCDDALAGRPGCWAGAGKLDSTPGYRAEESPGGISRIMPICAGETLFVNVATRGAGPTPMTVAIDFDTSTATQGRARGQVPPGTRAVVPGTAPAGARKAYVQLYPAAGTTVTEAHIAHRGSCSR